MNQLFPLLTAAALYTNTIVPQTYYISNLSETDGSKAGEYITVTPMQQPVIQYQSVPLILTPEENNKEE